MRVVAWPAFRNQAWNPYNALLYAHLSELGVTVEEFTPARVMAGRFDLWHIHWPEGIMSYHAIMSMMAESAFRLLISRVRRLGIPVIWTAHNLVHHDQLHPARETRFMDWFSRHISGCISLSSAGLELVTTRYPAVSGLCSSVIRHGHYRDVYPKVESKEVARKSLGLGGGQAVILFIGQVRPYKGVEELIAAFRALEWPDARLLIAGRVKSFDLAARLDEEAATDPRVTLLNGFMVPEQLAVLCTAADVVVLPYREVLNSGSAMLALSYDRPVVVPEIGAMRELQDEVGENWVRTFQGELTVDVLRTSIAWALSRSRSEGSPELPEWDDIARQTLSFYNEVRATVTGR